MHIIAQKADGALRDALSTFDRVVSFAGKDLTRKAVTENLNVLDYDTYFEVTDLLLSNDIPQLLLKFNDIISQGFDGHHFISGLASHFRDLMVCKNPATLSLLEVGDETKKKYQKQAQQIDMPFLLAALDTANDCDLKYRTSRNPRLLVELCLMQLASISQRGDGEKKKPERSIIPPSHFKERKVADTEKNGDATVTERQVERKTSGEQRTPDAQQADQNSGNKSQTPEDQGTQLPQQPDHKFIEEPQPPKQVASAQQNEEKTVKKAPDLSHLESAGKHVSAFSNKGFRKKKEILHKQKERIPDEAQLPREPFTEIALQAEWKEYVNRLRKRGEKILASNMEVDKPTLKGTEIHLEFPNNTMKTELERAQGGLLEYLKRKLNNYDISLVIEVNEQADRKFAFTPREKYEKMKEMNPDLELLLKTFDLDL